MPITCGTAITQTFTVNNVYNSPGTLSYTWNLGSSSNGWLYNGSPAPQFITTSTNAISLTSICSSAQSNITAVANLSGTNYNTNTSSINLIQPTLSIDGNNTLCTSESYSISNLPCNASVSWALSNSIASLTSTSGSSTTLNANGSGTVILTGTVTTPNCSTIIVTKNITVGGTQQSGSIYVNASYGPKTTTWGTWNIIEYGFSSTPVYITMSRPSTWTYNWGPVAVWWQSGNTMTFIPSTYPFLENTISFTVQSTNECGQLTSNITYFQNIVAAQSRNAFSIYPNPTKGELTISSKEANINSDINMEMSNHKNKIKEKAERLKIEKIELLNSNGKILKQYSGISIQRSINISEYPAGIYILRIFDGKKWHTDKIVKQ